jgi:hypothetical protein
MVIGTDQGKIYTFSPRSISKSFTYLTSVDHSSLANHPSWRSDSSRLIQDIKVDYKSQIIFIVAGDEVYAQKYSVKKT